MQFLMFLVMGVFAVLLHNSEAAITQDQMQEMMKVIMDCALKEKATQYDLDELFARMPPTTKTANCLHACISEKFNLVKDNKLNVDGFIQMEQMKYDYDSVKKQIVQDIAKECGGITDSDRCESAAKIFICIHNAAEARRLMFDM